MRDNSILICLHQASSGKTETGLGKLAQPPDLTRGWLKMAGAHVKDAQGQMRHARASTTLHIYQQFVAPILSNA